MPLRFIISVEKIGNLMSIEVTPQQREPVDVGETIVGNMVNEKVKNLVDELNMEISKSGVRVLKAEGKSAEYLRDMIKKEKGKEGESGSKRFDPN
jgi:hypothetical protein